MNPKSHKKAVIFFFVLALSGVANAQPRALAELEKLDAAANLLLFTSDSARPTQCHIKPEEAKKLLMVIHPMIDESKTRAAATASDPKWEKTCSKSCHCGLYASILDGRGDQSLSEKEREMMRRLYQKAQKMTFKEAKSCATRDAAWFCKSDLLKKLRKEAKDYPNPAQRKQPVVPHG
jgi:hypothetical protein